MDHSQATEELAILEELDRPQWRALDANRTLSKHLIHAVRLSCVTSLVECLEVLDVSHVVEGYIVLCTLNAGEDPGLCEIQSWQQYMGFVFQALQVIRLTQTAQWFLRGNAADPRLLAQFRHRTP